MSAAYLAAGRTHARRVPDSTAVLCTLGPASLDPRVIRRLEQSGATLFRVNLSHTSLAELDHVIDLIQAATTVPLCIDTEGAQIRTGELIRGSVELRENTLVRAHVRRVPGDAYNLNLYPREAVGLLRPGDFLSIDFNSALVQVVETDAEGAVLRVLQGGLVGQNKGVSVERDIALPALTDKDRAALQVARERGIRHVALSFARDRGDVEELRGLVGDDAVVIAKVESRAALENLDAIAVACDALLIDRGDLSRQVPIELLPQTQKRIIARARSVGVPVYVATNLLESMVTTPTPSRAEVNDIHNTLADGADGLVLAAETAIGSYPVQCAAMVRKLITAYQRGRAATGGGFALEAVSLLPEPHGGALVERRASEQDLAELAQLPRLAVSRRDLMDCEQLATGTYSPLTGMMDRETLISVLESDRLPSGEVWTLPIILQLPRRDPRLGEGQRVALTDDAGSVHALLDVTEVYRFDLDRLCRATFGTTSRAHPGVQRLWAGGDVLVAGEVRLVQPLASPYRHYLLTPAQTRFIFSRLGWSQVVAFHTRNPAHRGHEAIQLEALERTGADGLYINPVASTEKPGDFLPGPILLSYQALVDFGHYPQGKVVLGSFFTYARYAGPREAVFTALCRKNMGCSHIVVGRDHTGVGDHYAPDASRQLFSSLGDIGIEPVFFDTVGYNASMARYEVDRGQGLSMISGTRVRESLRAGERLPDWFMRDLVQEVLVSEIQSGRPVFAE